MFLVAPTSHESTEDFSGSYFRCEPISTIRAATSIATSVAVSVAPNLDATLRRSPRHRRAWRITSSASRDFGLGFLVIRSSKDTARACREMTVRSFRFSGRGLGLTVEGTDSSRIVTVSLA